MNFDYLEPKSLGEACSLLLSGGNGVRAISGGTELLVKMKRGLIRPQRLVNLKAISGLDFIKYRKGSGASIGSMATLSDVATSQELKGAFHILAGAASKVASPLIRNLATIGGNLCQDVRCYYYDQSEFWRKSIEPCIKLGGTACHQVKSSKLCIAIFYSDMAPPLIALGARAKIVSPDGERRVELKDFFIGAGDTLLKKGELLAELEIDDLPLCSGSSYVRHSLREALDYPLAIASAVLTVSPSDGRCTDARVALGAISSKPVRAEEIEGLIKGGVINDGLVEKAAEMAKKHVAPLRETFCAPDYRRQIIAAALKKAIRAAYQNALSRKEN